METRWESDGAFAERAVPFAHISRNKFQLIKQVIY